MLSFVRRVPSVLRRAAWVGSLLLFVRRVPLAIGRAAWVGSPLPFSPAGLRCARVGSNPRRAWRPTSVHSATRLDSGPGFCGPRAGYPLALESVVLCAWNRARPPNPACAGGPGGEAPPAGGLGAWPPENTDDESPAKPHQRRAGDANEEAPRSSRGEVTTRGPEPSRRLGGPAGGALNAPEVEHTR